MNEASQDDSDHNTEGSILGLARSLRGLMTSLVTVTAGNQTPIFTCEGRGRHLYGYRYSSFFFLQIDTTSGRPDVMEPDRP